MEFTLPTCICPRKLEKYTTLRHSKNFLSYRNIILTPAGLKLIQNQADLELA